MSWRQTLFTKLNRPLSKRAAALDVDEYHVLTAPAPAARGYLRGALSQRRRGVEGLTLMIERSGRSIFVSVSGRTGDVLGSDHPFAREIPPVAGQRGRRITFLHVYEADAADRPRVPTMDELLNRQREDLLQILSAAHDGGEPVDVPDRDFSGVRGGPSDWDEVAAAVASGRRSGAIFSDSGRLVRLLEPPGGAAQKKTCSSAGSAGRSVGGRNRPDDRGSRAEARRRPRPATADAELEEAPEERSARGLLGAMVFGAAALICYAATAALPQSQAEPKDRRAKAARRKRSQMEKDHGKGFHR